MNFIDALLVLVVLLSAYVGWRRGFLLGAFDLLRWAACLLLGLRFYPHAARLLTSVFGTGEVWAPPLGFLLTAVTAGVLVQLLGYAALRRLPERVHKSRLNRLFGVLPGAASGLVLAAILAALLLAMPLSDGPHSAARDSALANRLAVYTEQVETQLVPIFGEAVRRSLNRVTPAAPETEGSVNLPFVVTETRPLPELEARMLEKVNAERAAAGLKPLAPDPEMTEVARRHSADMLARSYFSHHTPEGRSPFDRMRAAGVAFRTAGENLALAPTLDLAHTGLMNSPGHRANILHRDFGRLGIGIMDGGRHGLMVTQNFRN